MATVIRINHVGTYDIDSNEFISACNNTADTTGSNCMEIIPHGNGQASIYYWDTETE